MILPREFCIPAMNYIATYSQKHQAEKADKGKKQPASKKKQKKKQRKGEDNQNERKGEENCQHRKKRHAKTEQSIQAGHTQNTKQSVEKGRKPTSKNYIFSHLVISKKITYE